MSILIKKPSMIISITGGTVMIPEAYLNSVRRRVIILLLWDTWKDVHSGINIPELLTDWKKTGVDESSPCLNVQQKQKYIFTSLNHEASLWNKKILFGDSPGQRNGWTRYTYTFHNENACRHLFLSPPVVILLYIGEPEILGQVKDAYRIAGFNNATGFLLNKVFHKTFNVAKRIRTKQR